jgi:thymidylate synthase
MMHHFEGETASELWQNAATALSESDVAKYGKNNVARELLHVTLCLSNPRQRWVNVRIPAFNPAFAIAEVIWIVKGRQDAAFLTFWNPRLPEFVGDKPVLHGAYGHRLRSHFALDQLQRAHESLSSHPECRQVVLQIWDAQIDLPDVTGQPVDRDIPCNVLAMLKVRNERLEWMQVIRSNDIYLGLPYNLIQFTSLQEIMAGWLGVEVGSFQQISDSLHLYDRDVEKMKVDRGILSTVNPDSLALSKRESDVVLEIMNTSVERMIDPMLSRDALLHLPDQAHLPRAYKNLLSILQAEVARRREWPDLIPLTIEACSNPMLKQAWERWYRRTQYSTHSD